jgi:hypothetical protein
MWNIFRIWNGGYAPDSGNYAAARHREQSRRAQIHADNRADARLNAI